MKERFIVKPSKLRCSKYYLNLIYPKTKYLHQTLKKYSTAEELLKIVVLPHELLSILGDPGADKGGEGKSKRVEKYIWNEEK